MSDNVTIGCIYLQNIGVQCKKKLLKFQKIVVSIKNMHPEKITFCFIFIAKIFRDKSA